MGNPLAQLMTLLQGDGGWAPDVQRSGVRPDFGLSTVQSLGGTAKSPYERTLRPGEQRRGEELRDMLAEVILAAGSAAIPGVARSGDNLRVAGSRAKQTVPTRLAPREFRAAKPEDSVVLYHGTTAENAKGILSRGFRKGFSNPESGTPSDAPSGIYLAPDVSTARNYSPDGTVVAVRIKKSLLQPDTTLKAHEDPYSSLYKDFQGAARTDYGNPLEILGTFTGWGKDFTPVSKGRSRK